MLDGGATSAFDVDVYVRKDTITFIDEARSMTTARSGTDGHRATAPSDPNESPPLRTASFGSRHARASVGAARSAAETAPSEGRFGPTAKLVSSLTEPRIASSRAPANLGGGSVRRRDITLPPALLRWTAVTSPFADETLQPR